MIVYHVALVLRRGRDDDLIEFCERQEPRQRAGAIKAALRAGGMVAVSAQVDAEDEEVLDVGGFLL